MSNKKKMSEEYRNELSEQVTEFYNKPGINNDKSGLSKFALVFDCVCVAAFVIFIILAAFVFEDQNIKFIFFVAAVAVLAIGIKNSFHINKGKAYYECLNCKTSYRPTIKTFAGGKRRGVMFKMKCEHCGQKVWHRQYFVKEPKNK